MPYTNDPPRLCPCGLAPTCDLRCDDLAEATPPVPTPTPQSYNFNPDPAWHDHVARYESVILKIAIKKCSADEDLRQDVMQEARIALATVRPEEVDAYARHQRGEIDAEKWARQLDRYCRNVIRNAILSYLDSYRTGNWYIGRTRHVKDKLTGQTRKIHIGARFASLDELTEEYGMQVDDMGEITWPDTHRDTLPLLLLPTDTPVPVPVEDDRDE